MENLKVSVVESKPCLVTLKVEVPAGEVVNTVEKTFTQIQNETRVPGFRVGKAPKEFVRKNFEGLAKERASEKVIQAAVFSAFKEKNIDPITYPQIGEFSFEFNKPCVFNITAQVHPKVTINDYTGIKIKKEDKPVTDEMVEKSLQEQRERNARLKDASPDTAISANNFALLDYDSFVDNALLKELSAKNQLIDLSSKQLIEGLQEGLLGAKKGDERQVEVSFPADSPIKKAAGKKVLIKAKVNQVKDKILPNIDDEFAKDLGLKDISELKEKLKQSLEAQEKSRVESDLEKQIVDELLAANSFEVPAVLIEEQMSFISSRADEYMRSYGMPEFERKKKIEAEKENYKKEAEKTVRLSYILNVISEKEKLEVTPNDMNAEKERLLAANHSSKEQTIKYFSENSDKITAHLKEEKIFKFLIEKAKIK